MEVGRYHNYKRGSSHQNIIDSGRSDQKGYCPFRTPIISSRSRHAPTPLKSCRVLFEEDEDSILNSIDTNIQRNNEIGVKDGILSFGKIFLKEKENNNGQLPSQETKQNSLEYQSYSFNNRMRLKYPQTPIFKKILQSPMSQFNRMFEWRTSLLKNQIKRKTNLTSFDTKYSPLEYKDYGYRYFICLAEHYKKTYNIVQTRIFYTISVYMQPYDQSVWEWIIKFQQQIGDLQRAYHFSKISLMFVKSQNIILKYLKLGDKLQKPMEEMRGIVNQVFLKFEQTVKIYLQLAKLQYKFNNNSRAYNIYYYLLKQVQNNSNSNITLQLIKILQNQKEIPLAINILYNAIENGCKSYSIYSLYLKLLQSIYYFDNQHVQYIQSKAEAMLPHEVLWKLILDVARYYCITEQQAKYIFMIKKALIIAPNNAKIKPYIMIQKLRCSSFIENSQCSLLIVEENKKGFLCGNVMLYNFSQWKHYLHYSLFYTFYGNIQARVKLQQAALKWPYAGRLWTEILWVMRVSKEDVLNKWKQIIQQVPKSGQVWCQGGRIFAQQGDLQSAMFCFNSAIHLTPQYGDSFIEAMKILMIKGSYKQLKCLKKKILNSQPFYGNLWCFLKDHPKSSAAQIYRKAKYCLRQQLYKHSIGSSNGLTALDDYNCLFEYPNLVQQGMKEKIISAYDQLENNKY